MKKCASLFLLIFFTSICHGQIKAFKNASTSDNFTILVGPENVDRYYPGQSNDYINEYRELKEIAEIKLSRIEPILARLENKRVRNVSKMNRYELKVNIYYKQIELLEDFISYWVSHEEVYKEAQNIFSSKSDSLKCYGLANEDKVFQSQDFYIAEKKAAEVLIYYELVDSSYFGGPNVWSEIKYRKEDQNVLTGLPYSSKEPLLILTDTHFAIIKSFRYDEEKNEFFREKEVELREGFKQFIAVEKNVEIMPLDLVRVDCEEEGN